MNFNQNRLRFVHCEHLFSNFTEITEYVRSVQYERASLYAEPMIFKYGDEKNPCIVLAIGSVGEGKFEYDTENGEVLNKTYYIDFSQVERDIVELYKQVGENREEIERIDGIVKNMITSCGFDEEGKYVPELNDHILGDATSLFVADKMLSEYIIALEKRHELYVKDTSTIDLTVEKAETGVTLSSDVKLGTKLHEGKVIENIILEQEDGIFTSVDLDYSEEDSKLIFTINGDTVKDVPLPVEAHVVKGEYDPYSEKLILTLNNAVEIDGVVNDKVEINMAKLIDEWDVLGEASETPIVLTKEHVKSIDSEHEGMFDYQDILKADIRILDKTKSPDNILSKDSSGKFLYVDGSAVNISYLRNNEKINVQQGLDEKLSKTDISSNFDNIINLQQDGLFSFVDMSFDSKTNTISFKRSNINGDIIESKFELNSVSFIQTAYYDTTTEEIVIVYNNGDGEMKELRIPLQIIVNELAVDNTNATVTLTIVRNPQGQDTIKGDVNISSASDNILENIGHTLYVRGYADNIKMTNKTFGENVEQTISGLHNVLNTKIETEISDRTNAINNVVDNLNQEIERAKAAERLLQDNIDAEARLAREAEAQLQRNIDAEEKRATDVEKDLREDLESEIIRAKGAETDLRNDLESEIFRSTTEDKSLSNQILSEIERAKSAEHVIAVDLINETERAMLKESELERVINHEIERSKSLDETLTNNLASEIERAKKVEETLRVGLESEIERAKASELTLTDSIQTESDRATWAEHTLQDNIDKEQARAEAAEKVLTDNLDIEVLRAKQAEEVLTIKLTEEKQRATSAEKMLDEKIDIEIERSTSSDEKITNNLEQAKKDLSYVVKNSGTVSLTKTIEETGSSIIGKVNVSSENYNLINQNGEPLYASVDLLYDAKSNMLTLKRSGSADKTIQLNEGSLIESIVYDEISKELVITYYNSYGNERQERVSVSDLFNQWVVETNHLGAVQLTKDLNYDGKGTDRLTAEVVVSSLKSNLLVNDKGSLYVSNSANDIVLSDGTSVNENLVKLNAKDAELQSNIDNEVLRAKEAEAQLQRNIDAEISRASDAEKELNRLISEEVTRATNSENKIISDLTKEISRSEVKDNELESLLNAETERAKEAETLNADAIAAENVRAEKAEHLLEDAINKEINDARSAEEKLNEKISAEIERATNSEISLDNKVTAEISRSEAKDNELEVAIRKESETARDAELVLTNAIKDEKNRAEKVEHLLEDAINKEVSTARDAETALRQDLNDEIVRAKDSETSLSKRITAEVDRAKAEERNLQVAIDNESLRATAAENANYGAIKTEEYRATKAEHDLSDLLLAETTRAEKAESSLQENINLEQARAEGVETELRALISNNALNIANEQSRALAAETELRNDIDAETARAIAADDNLRGLISTETERAVKEEGRIESLLNTEIGRAQTEEANLSKEIEKVKSQATDNSEKIDETIVQVEEIVKTYAMSVKDTATVNLTKEVIDAGGFIVSADVKLSNTEGNQLIQYSDGLYTNVILTYSANNNTLQFTANGTTTEIPLTSVSTIEEIEYAPSTNEIVIKYISNGELKETRFPAASMFKPIVTNNDNKNIVLSTVTNAEGATELSAKLYFKDNVNNDNSPITLYATEDNKLKAKLNIADSAAANNILEITSDGSGVWVNGVATNIEMVQKQLGWGTDEYPFYQADDVETAIHYLDGRVNDLRKDFEEYVDEDLVNSLMKDINNLKSKTDINAIVTPGIDLTYESTESSSSLKANIIVSDDPHNLLTVYSDTQNEFVAGVAHKTDGSGNFIDEDGNILDIYDGILFDGNIDYLTFNHKDVYSGGTDHYTDWTRHLQLKRDNEIFASKDEALAFLHEPSFLSDKKDGEPLLARYVNGDETSFILGFVRVVDGQKTLQTLDNKGTMINALKYVPNATVITTTDAYGNETVTNVAAESLYLEFTESSSLKHTIVAPLKELVEEYVYPESVSAFDGKVVNNDYKPNGTDVVDGVNNAKEIFDEEGNPIYVETTVREHHNVNFDIERHEDGKSIVKADVDYYDCGEYDGEDYIKPESYIIAYFDAEDTTTPYTIVNGEAANHIIQTYVDGVEKGTVNQVTFDTVGNHKVKVVFDYENITDMSQAFMGSKMKTINLEDLDISRVTNINSMFKDCKNITSLNVGIMDTTNVTDMGNLLVGCTNLTIIGLNGLKTSKVTNMEGMLSGLPKISTFDLSNLDFRKVSNMNNLFKDDIILNEVKIMSDILNNVTIEGMFENVKNDNAEPGKFYYNVNYNYSRIINILPKEWNAMEA